MNRKLVTYKKYVKILQNKLNPSDINLEIKISSKDVRKAMAKSKTIV